MNISNLHLYFQSWGMLVRPGDVERFNQYATTMIRRNRVIVVNGDDGMEAILFYFVTDDRQKFANRPMWTTPEDQESGSTIFFDKMVARKWTKSLRLAVEKAIETKYPLAEEAFWLREPENRNVIIKRRREHVHS